MHTRMAETKAKYSEDIWKNRVKRSLLNKTIQPGLNEMNKAVVVGNKGEFIYEAGRMYGEDSGESAGIVSITRGMAQEILDSGRKNRDISTSKVKELVSQFNEVEEIQVNGESIIFNDEGLLMDGQHRLTAFLLSEHEVFRTAISCGVDKSRFVTIDTGKNRTGGDALQLAYDLPYARDVAAGIKYVEELESLGKIGRGEKGTCSNVDIVALYAKYDDGKRSMLESVKFMKRTCKPAILPPAVISGFHFVFSEIDRNKADQFFTLLIHDEGDRNVAVHRLREYLQEARANKSNYKKLQLSRDAKAALVIITWNSFIAGRVGIRVKYPEVAWNSVEHHFPEIGVLAVRKKTLEEKLRDFEKANNINIKTQGTVAKKKMSCGK